VKGDPPLAAGDPLAGLQAVSAGTDLSAAESEALFARIMDGSVPSSMIAALLAALATKGETSEEIAGAARVMRARATRVPTNREPLVDTCGTGGDLSGSINVSTGAALVVAAAGIAVAKHGNRAASSRCGSADVLEALGVTIDLEPASVGRSIDELGIGFLYAPRFHPAMRHAAQARR
jgi:anthranilate phosphoribosyltransferase